MKSPILVFLSLLLSTAAFTDGEWAYFVSMNDLKAVDVHGADVWCASTNGVIRWNRADGTYRKYYSCDGIPFSKIDNVLDGENESIYFSTYEKIEEYQNIFENKGYGVFRFDGSVMSSIGHPAPQPGYFAAAMGVDSLGNVWFSTVKDYSYDLHAAPPNPHWLGLSIFDGDQWESVTTDNSGLLDNNVTALAREEDSIVWYGYDKGGISRFDGIEWKHYSQEDCDLLQHGIRNIFIDSVNTKWIITDRGVMSFDGVTWGRFFDMEQTYRIIGDQMNNGSICLYVCFNASTHIENLFYIIESGGMKQVQVPLPELSRDTAVRDVAVDGTGALWVATERGLYTNAYGEWMRLDDTDLPPFASAPVFVDSRNRIWTAYHRYEDGSWRDIEEYFGFNPIQAYGVDNYGTILAGTSQQLLSFDGEQWNRIVYGNISKIVVSADDIIWCRHNAGIDTPTYMLLMVEEGYRTVFHQRHVNDLCYDVNGYILTAEDNGIGKYTRVQGTQYVGGIFVREIEVDAAGTIIWYVAKNLLYSITDGRFWKHYTVTGDDITLTVDLNGIAWTVSDEGVFSCDGETVTEYTIDDGLLRNEVDDIVIGPDNSKWFVFSGDTGLGLARYKEREITSVSRAQELTGALPVYNRPNPFNPSTVIEYIIREPSDVKLSVYSIAGQRVATLVDGYLPAGKHTALFDGSDLASGIYFYRLETGGAEKNGKMLLLK